MGNSVYRKLSKDSDRDNGAQGSDAPRWQFYNRPAFERGLMRAETDAGPVGGLASVREWIAILDKGADNFVREVRVTAAVAGALRETKVRFLSEIVDTLGREWLDRFRKPLREIRCLDRLGNLWLGQFRRVHDQRLMLDERPLNRAFATININAFAILPGRVEQAADNAGVDVRPGELDVRRLDREGRIVMLDEFLADGSAPKTTHIFRRLPDKPSHGADAMRGVPHWRQPRPVVRPAVHILLVARLDELEFAQFPGVEQFLHEKVLARIHDGLGHHVFAPSLLHKFDDLLAFRDARCHRYRAGHMLAGFQRGDRLPPVIRDRRIDVHEVHIRILE